VPVTQSYFRLVKRHPLLCVANDDDLGAALAVIERLLKADLDESEEAYLDALTALVHAYESKAHPIPPSEPGEVLRGLAEANSLSGSQVAARTGISPSTISHIMTGKRRPTPEQAVPLQTCSTSELPRTCTARKAGRK
jgi:HTH-type transcriptional regulator/antitoxin HigA